MRCDVCRKPVRLSAAILDSPFGGPSSASLAILGSTLIGATFAALEAALAALGEARLRALKETGRVHIPTVDRAIAELPEIRARLLVGRNLAVAFAVVIAALQMPGPALSLAAAGVVAFGYSMTAAVASAVARRRASRSTIWLLRLFRPVELILAPIAKIPVLLGRVVEKIVPPPHDEDPREIDQLAVEKVIEEGEERGSIAEDDADMLRSVLEFRDTLAREVMVPRTQVVAFEISTPLSEVLTGIVEAGHSRYPIYRERMDQIEGTLCAKDLFRLLSEKKPLDRTELRDIIRKPGFFVAESQKIGSLLREMQSRRVHLTVVVDEFGATAGIVTLEDILEEIVGEIRDEHDTDEGPIRQIAPGRFVVDAGVSVYDLEETIGAHFRKDDEGTYDSLGGMIIELVGRVPAEGESIIVDGFDLTVRSADERRVKWVELVRRREEPSPVGTA